MLIVLLKPPLCPVDFRIGCRRNLQAPSYGVMFQDELELLDLVEHLEMRDSSTLFRPPCPGTDRQTHLSCSAGSTYDRRISRRVSAFAVVNPCCRNLFGRDWSVGYGSAPGRTTFRACRFARITLPNESSKPYIS